MAPELSGALARRRGPRRRSSREDMDPRSPFRLLFADTGRQARLLWQRSRGKDETNLLGHNFITEPRDQSRAGDF
jgi:hypothetical protein